MDAVTSTPLPRNEPVRDYAPGTPERASLAAALAELGGVHHELTVTIDGDPPSRSPHSSRCGCWRRRACRQV